MGGCHTGALPSFASTVRAKPGCKDECQIGSQSSEAAEAVRGYLQVSACDAAPPPTLLLQGLADQVATETHHHI